MEARGLGWGYRTIGWEVMVAWTRVEAAREARSGWRQDMFQLNIFWMCEKRAHGCRDWLPLTQLGTRREIKTHPCFGKIPRATEPPDAGATTAEARSLASALHNKRSHRNGKRAYHNEEQPPPRSPQWDSLHAAVKTHHSRKDKSIF